MAEKKKGVAHGAPPPQSFDADKHYKVSLSAPITVGNRRLMPGQVVYLKGSVAEANRSAISDAEVLAE